MLKLKKVAVLIMLIAMTLSTTAFAFSDISDPKVEASANTLASLGIINGIGEDKFDPDGNITRAQFAKIAVMTLGSNNLATYKNFTIFPDVTNTHWASAYVNMAVKEYGIIKGFSDGTFNPEGNITYEQAITMMLYMLDYEIADIGPYWPTDYIDKAQEIGLTQDIEFVGSENLTRGDAAILITHLLQIETKESGTLIEKAFPYTDSDAMIIASSQTDSSLNSNQVKVSISGYETTKVCELSDISYGASGTFVYEDSSKSKIISFVQDCISQTYIIKNAYIDKIVTADEEIVPLGSTTLIVEGEVSTYGLSWLDIFPGCEIIVNYDTSGNITSIVANNAISFEKTFLYTGKELLSAYKIYKNGSIITEDYVNIDDVITISDDKAYVSDTKITGIYESSTPSVFYPTEITVLGHEFSIPQSVRTQFNALNIDDVITLFLDHNGSVVYVKHDYDNKQVAYLNSFDGSNINITLDNYFTTDVTIDPDDSGYFNSGVTQYSNVYKSIGKFVDLTFSTDKIKVTENKDFIYINEDYLKEEFMLGKYSVASNVEFYEGISSSSAYTPVAFNDVTLSVIPKENIISCVLDENNEICKIVFTDVTGDNLDYGLLTSAQEEVSYYNGVTGQMDTYNSNLFKLTTSEGTLTYPSINYTKVFYLPAGFQKTLSDRPYKQVISYVSLNETGKVDETAFLGSKYVQFDDTIHNISENVVVYDSKDKRFIDLSYARQNYTSFTLYKDNALQNSMVRIIIV